VVLYYDSLDINFGLNSIELKIDSNYFR